MRRTLMAGVALAVTLGLAGCGAAGSETGSDKPLRIGLLTALSGPASIFGKPYTDAFEAGLAYATDGTMKVDGRSIEVVKVDDKADQAAAIAGATKLVTDGVKIFGGTMSSAEVPALADFAKTNSVLYFNGYASSDAATGANDYTFRSAKQVTQDAMAFSEVIGDSLSGKRLCFLVHDNAYGKEIQAATQKQLEGKVGEFKTILVPFPTSDVAPYVLRLKQAACDGVVPMLSNSVADFWNAFKQQGITTNSVVVSLVSSRVDWPTYIDGQAPKVRLIAPYFLPASGGKPKNPADEAMNKALQSKGNGVDYVSADAFGFAMALVDALKKAGSDDPKKVGAALEGLTVDAPRGQTTIRKEDHALLAPQVEFHFEGDRPVLDQVIPASALQPPLK